jgi:hypothetical protein
VTGPAEARLPECVRKRLDRDGLKTALRLLSTGGRVEERVWLRRGVAGRVVAPNGRENLALLAFDSADGLLSATCPCTPKQRPFALCAHLGALAAALARPDASGAARFPGEHFAESPWLRAVEGLVESFPSGLRATAGPAGSNGEPTGVVVENGDGLALASLAGSGEPWAGLARSIPVGATPVGSFPRLRHAALLAQLVRTTEERTLNDHGVKSRRQAVEESPLFVLAAWAFDATATKEWAARVETDASGAWLVAAGGGGELWLRLEGSALAGTPFDLFVLDEVQTVKNRETATHQALRAIRAGTVVGLTGTPVENGVEELRTLLDFVLPGYLPPEAEFRRGFVRPIEEGDEAARERLRRLVRPFVLRRTKAQVALGLPEKLLDRRECEMTPGQAALYRVFLDQRGGPLRAALEGPGPVPYLHVFALLTKLKQLCDHPDLLRPQGDPPGEEGSGKWDLLVELLEEALGSGLKVVVFSQYLRMLDRMGEHLTEAGVGFETLRGATVDRAAPVARFRDDPSCRVFLASLRAAGVGIDLTPASVVVHYDRWWNAAREEQATDRVHRIGQTRGVQVVTLVTRGTVEERIDRLIAEKARLARDLVPEEDPRVLRRFTREELRGLLEE